MKLVIVPDRVSVEYFLDDERSTIERLSGPRDSGSHIVTVVPKSLLYGIRDVKVHLVPGRITRRVVHLRRVLHRRPVIACALVFAICGLLAVSFNPVMTARLASNLPSNGRGDPIMHFYSYSPNAILLLWSAVSVLATVVLMVAVRGIEFGDPMLKRGASLCWTVLSVGPLALWGVSCMASSAALPLAAQYHAVIVAGSHAALLGCLIVAPFPDDFYRTRV